MMRAVAYVMSAIVLIALAAMPAVRAQTVSNSAVHIVTYIEAAPASAQQNATLLKQFADASRKEAGLLRFEVLARAGHPGHFAIVASWKDQPAADAHAATAHNKQFYEKLTPSLIAPVDDRVCNTITVGPVQAVAPAGAIFVMTHVDIAGPNPQNRDAMIPVLKAFGESSRNVTGNLRYDVLQQTSRTNHFQIVEVWKDKKADGDHESSAANKAYRAKVGALQGALYDQRWYTPL
jgi:quinol monooxygenase YgiN